MKSKICIISLILILTGGLMCGIALASKGFDFKSLSNVKYVDKSFEISDDFSKISIDIKTDDIEFLLSNENICRVEIKEEEKITHTVSAEDDTLYIKVKDKRKWYDHINFFGSSPKIKVYLPKSEYENLTLSSSTGDVKLPEGLTFSSMKLDLSTGDVSCKAAVLEKAEIKTSTGDIKMSSFESDADLDIHVSTGDIKLSDVICGSLNIKCSTGDVKFDGFDAKEIYVKTSTGDISGTLLSDKVFLCSASTGDINVPRTTEGGVCELKTSAGDIRISIK